MDFQQREKEIFETLKKLKGLDFIVIGGYAVNAYTFPRFSIDCDIVVKDSEGLMEIEERLSELGYGESKDTLDVPYNGKFKRYEKEISKGFKVSMDILIGEVLDRQTKATFSAGWIFDNSSIKTLKGKTISEELKVRIVNLDALFVLKMISCRSTDIRDIFLLVSDIDDKEWIVQEVAKRCDFEDRLGKSIKEISSKQFKDGLQGVFGIVDEKIFERNKKLMQGLSAVKR